MWGATHKILYPALYKLNIVYSIYFGLSPSNFLLLITIKIFTRVCDGVEILVPAGQSKVVVVLVDNLYVYRVILAGLPILLVNLGGRVAAREHGNAVVVTGPAVEERPYLRAAEPPLARVARESGVGPVDVEPAVVEPPVLALLEKVGFAVVPLEGAVYIGGEAPEGDVARVLPGLDVRRLLRVKLPVIVALEEIDFAVAAPNERRVNVSGDGGEALGELARVVGHCLHVLKLPVLRAFEEVRGSKIFPGECRVNVGRQAGPVVFYPAWVAVCHTIVSQPPVVAP